MHARWPQDLILCRQTLPCLIAILDRTIVSLSRSGGPFATTGCRQSAKACLCIRSFGRCHTVRPPTDKPLAKTQGTSQASDDVQNVGQLLVILLSLKGHVNQLLYSPQLTCQAAATSSSLDSMHSRKSKQGLNETSGRLPIFMVFTKIACTADQACGNY